MRICYDYWARGKKHALTMSYDDGKRDDLRLLEIFDRYGIRGSFHLNSGKIGSELYVTAEEVRERYRNHEISAHTVTHPNLCLVPREALIYEVLEDRRGLEAICAYPVRGMSYPFGKWDDRVVAGIRELGICYSRTVRETGKLSLPEDFLAWHPTCHHNDPRLMELLDKFRKQNRHMPLLYVWGHSYEFARDDNWQVIEDFCREAGGDPDIWYATNIEIYDYVTALRALVLSVDRTTAYNPTATDVWIGVDGVPVHIPAGATVRLG
ncbi:MAG: polysaccharide deacetylase family protein [Clostridia bacterium]|nr:polysaccharide deacetylase family protein [Clostridia bacterium]